MCRCVPCFIEVNPPRTHTCRAGTSTVLNILPPLLSLQTTQHLERNRKDKDSKFRLILIESRIHRLARYYRTTRKLTPNWKYESSTAASLVA